jgi:hypothetical protein
VYVYIFRPPSSRSPHSNDTVGCLIVRLYNCRHLIHDNEVYVQFTLGNELIKSKKKKSSNPIWKEISYCLSVQQPISDILMVEVRQANKKVNTNENQRIEPCSLGNTRISVQSIIKSPMMRLKREYPLQNVESGTITLEIIYRSLILPKQLNIPSYDMTSPVAAAASSPVNIDIPSLQTEQSQTILKTLTQDNTCATSTAITQAQPPLPCTQTPTSIPHDDFMFTSVQSTSTSKSAPIHPLDSTSTLLSTSPTSDSDADSDIEITWTSGTQQSRVQFQTQLPSTAAAASAAVRKKFRDSCGMEAPTECEIM